MLIPDRLQTLIDDGFIQRVIRPLKSGKEAAVFIVESDGSFCAAKVYKEVHQRNFRQRQDYTEGRSTGDSRQDRAMSSGSRFGKQQNETAWQSAEADTMRKLNAAGVRCPKLRQLADGVLLMDLVLDAEGQPAPQLASQSFTAELAYRWHRGLMGEIARMLCAGVVHGDLSEYNILRGPKGPVIIDFPQAIDATKNNNAKRLLLRDVANVTRFFSRFSPDIRRTQYGEEMWLLYEQNALKPDTVLTGRFAQARGVVDAQVILREIAAAKEEAAKRLEIKQLREEQKRDKLGRSSGKKSN